MRKFTIYASFLALTACSDSAKKLIVMSKGPADIDAKALTVKATDGSGHEEKTFVLGSGSYTLKLSSPAGEGTSEVKEDGLYVVNVKNDTIIGSFQNYVKPSEANALITQEQLKHRLDSLQLLSEGKNVSAANKNFFITPNQAIKITDNRDAIIVGPYHQMTSAETVNGKAPDVFRFFSIKEIRETIEKLKVLTTPRKV